MTFLDVVNATIAQPEFLKEYDRLNGTTFSKGGINQEIDKATGKFKEDVGDLLAFILEFVWAPLIEEKVNDLEEH